MISLEVRTLDLPNIQTKNDISKFIRSIDDGEEILYFKDQEYFFDDASYFKFIKEVEKMVRTSKDYAHFVGYIKNTLGMNFCQILSKVEESNNVEIEMHHGPIFTLYDICEVILNWFIKTGQRINTFRVAKNNGHPNEKAHEYQSTFIENWLRSL